MCAIAGLLSLTGANLDLKTFKEMVDLQAHRGPDDEGFAIWGGTEQKGVLPLEKSIFLSGKTKIALGHRRLSILDLSSAGRQPMNTPDDRYWITYNGEIYNYRELASELKSLGVQFKTGTDTEVILAAYQVWGTECLHRFNGMWALAIYDQRENSLFLARDRFGVKPFYFSFDENYFGFASEIKPLLAGGFCKSKSDRHQISQFLLYGDVNQSDKTCFENINELRPGYFVKWEIEKRRSGFKPQRFYSLPATSEVDARDDLNDLREQARFLLEDSVRLRLRSDVEVGSCLSGGLDSSFLVKTASHQLSGKSLKTFTSSFPGTDVDEWNFADMVNKAVNASSYPVYPKLENLENDLGKLIHFQEEPFRSSSIYAQWNVMQEANRQGIKVLLDGQGSDEIMAGYHFFLPIYFATLVKKNMWKKLFSDVGQLNKTGVLTTLDSGTRVFLKTVFWMAQGNKFRRQPIAKAMRKSAIRSRDTQFPKDINEALTQEVEISLPSLLRHEDRNSMAFSIEARTPFLDYRLVELFTKMAATSKVRDGWTKPFLRELMDKELPHQLVWRKQKLGFATPEKTWYQNNRNRLKSEVLKEFRLDSWFDKSLLAKTWDTLPSDRIWRVYCTQRWMQQFNLN